jgi:hypothetical protein
MFNGQYTNKYYKTTSHISKYLLAQSGYFMRFRGGVVTITGYTPDDLISYFIQLIIVQVVKLWALRVNVALQSFIKWRPVTVIPQL